MNERNENEIKVLQNSGDLPQKCDVELEREQGDAADVPDLQDPSSEEAQHADGVGVVAL